MKFCFFGNISGALIGKTPGGSELQIAILAKSLAGNGHNVTVIDPYAIESFTTPQGVKLIKPANWNKGLRFIRLFLYRLPALWAILVEQDADFYYVRTRSYLHIIPYLASKKTKGRFIEAIASDFDLLGFFEKLKQYKKNFKLLEFLLLEIPNELIFNFLLRKSDYIIFQHIGQSINIKSLKSKIVIFPNIIENTNNLNILSSVNKYFIYVGTLTTLKGSENLYKLINIVNNNIPFMIVGTAGDRKSEIIIEKLKKFKNIVLKGRLSHMETRELIAKSTALINTSYYEGFPNIFLEAWAAGIPVISLTVDPGRIFHKYNLGVCCNSDLNRMKFCIETNETDHFDEDELRAYVARFHDFESAADRFINAIAH